jgi:hypothetical protein
MKISDTCKCGAAFSAGDDCGSYAVASLTRKDGKKFQVEVIYAAWLEAHKVCRERVTVFPPAIPQTPTFPPSQPWPYNPTICQAKTDGGRDA